MELVDSRSQRWVSLLLLIYKDIHISHEVFLCNVKRLLHRNVIERVETFVEDNDCKIVIGLKNKIFLRGSSYFTYQGHPAEVYELKNFTILEELCEKWQDQKTEEKEKPPREEHEKKTIWNTDIFNLKVTEEDKKKFHTRASELLEYINSYEEIPTTRINKMAGAPIGVPKKTTPKIRPYAKTTKK